MSRKRYLLEWLSFMSLPILGSDPTPYHNSTDCTYNYYQATTSGLLLFVVNPRVSNIATKTLLLVGHCLDAKEIRVNCSIKQK